MYCVEQIWCHCRNLASVFFAFNVMGTTHTPYKLHTGHTYIIHLIATIFAQIHFFAVLLRSSYSFCYASSSHNYTDQFTRIILKYLSIFLSLLVHHSSCFWICCRSAMDLNDRFQFEYFYGVINLLDRQDSIPDIIPLFVLH